MVIDHGHIWQIEMSKIMKASEFKAKCLGVIDEVVETGKPVVVTKNGEPLVDLIPHKPAKKMKARGIWKSKIVITGDIISPIDVEWNALK